MYPKDLLNCSKAFISNARQEDPKMEIRRDCLPAKSQFMLKYATHTSVSCHYIWRITTEIEYSRLILRQVHRNEIERRVAYMPPHWLLLLAMHTTTMQPFDKKVSSQFGCHLCWHGGSRETLYPSLVVACSLNALMHLLCEKSGIGPVAGIKVSFPHYFEPKASITLHSRTLQWMAKRQRTGRQWV